MKEKNCISITEDKFIADIQISYLLNNHFYPKVKIIDNKFVIIVSSTEKEFKEIIENMPFRNSSPYRITEIFMEYTPITNIVLCCMGYHRPIPKGD